MNPSRRGFLLGLSGIIAAPAIVRAASIMPVKALPRLPELEIGCHELVRFVIPNDQILSWKVMYENVTSNQDFIERLTAA